MIKNPASNRGFTLTEVAIVLAICGIVMGAIWAAANTVRTKHRTETGINHVWQIVNGVRDIYKGHPFAAADTDVTAVVTGQGVITADMVENPWGGGYAVNFLNTNQFYVTVTPPAAGLAAAVCSDLLSLMLSVGARSTTAAAPTPVPTPAPALAGAEQGGMPTNAFFRNAGGAWVDVTGLDAVATSRAMAGACRGVAFYFTI